MQHKFKSRTFRRIKVRTTKGLKVHFRKPKPAKPKCADCGKVLAGVPNERPYKMMNMPKTAKRPERPFGGKLCSACMRKTIIARIRE